MRLWVPSYFVSPAETVNADDDFNRLDAHTNQRHAILKRILNLRNSVILHNINADHGTQTAHGSFEDSGMKHISHSVNSCDLSSSLMLSRV